MRIEQCQFVLEVARSGSMQKAAEALHTSSQNISKLIKQLEDEIHVQIFLRNKYGVFLTPDGEKVCIEAQKIMNSVSVLQNMSSDGLDNTCFCGKNEEISHLNILAAHSSRDLASEILEKICVKYSVTSASLISKDSKEINKLLEAESQALLANNDFIITNLDSYELTYLQNNLTHLKAYLLHKFRLGVHINQSNSLAGQKSISIKEIIQQPLIMNCYDFDYSSHVKALLQNSGITLKPKFIFNSAQAATHYIQRNLGYGIVPFNEYKQNRDSADNTIVIPLKERIFFYMVLVINPAVASEPYTKLALSVAKKTFKDMQALL